MNYLPDTDLASVIIDKKVFAYAQNYDGVLVECEGQLKTVRGATDVFSFQRHNHIISRYDEDTVEPGGPKLFTPLTAANIGNTKASVSMKWLRNEADVIAVLVLR
jgi:hypothetical protein